MLFNLGAPVTYQHLLYSPMPPPVTDLRNIALNHLGQKEYYYHVLEDPRLRELTGVLIIHIRDY